MAIAAAPLDRHPVEPDKAGFDPVRLARIDDHLRTRYLEPGKIAGVQVAVARGGVLAHHATLGRRDLERDRPVEHDTVWRLFSMTKPVTGVALLTLLEQGKVQLDDPVERFLPEFAGQKVKVRADDGTVRLEDPHRPMDVRDAMMHMTGIGYGPAGARLDLTNIGRAGFGLPKGSTLRSLTEALGPEPLRFHPGTHWLYSWSTDVCARLVEAVSGQDFDEYLRAAILDPLGMDDTEFWVDDERADRLAGLYGRGPDKRLVRFDDPDRPRPNRRPSFLSGGGGLLGTVADYLRFVQMLLNGGSLDGVRILGRRTVELMRTNHLPGGGDLSAFALPGGYGEVGFAGMGFGLTVAVSQGPVATARLAPAGSYLWGGAASTAFWIDPVEDLVVVFATQLLPSGTFDFRGQLASIVYGALDG